MFGVESEIAKGVADTPQGKITGREEKSETAKPTNNPEAYDAYLRGRAFEARATAASIHENVREAAGFFRAGGRSWTPILRLSGGAVFVWMGFSIVTVTVHDVGLLGGRNETCFGDRERLEPNSAETLPALGYYGIPYVLRDYGAVKATFSRVSKMLPG